MSRWVPQNIRQSRLNRCWCSTAGSASGQRTSDRYAGMEKGHATKTMHARWQDRWTNTQKGAGTRRMMPDVARRVRKIHGEPDFYLVPNDDNTIGW
ncbi:hypothetical protein J6590_092261 [Homalodisca vitripennis]|nr:hypothetical protein J6590_063091 [Homalodisca vitripennis]KAG8270108.1 hypothetical protein J6590_092261 [Homalodisca vitripennis]